MEIKVDRMLQHYIMTCRGEGHVKCHRSEKTDNKKLILK